jgi:hypothetical protein
MEKENIQAALSLSDWEIVDCSLVGDDWICSAKHPRFGGSLIKAIVPSEVEYPEAQFVYGFSTLAAFVEGSETDEDIVTRLHEQGAFNDEDVQRWLKFLRSAESQ